MRRSGPANRHVRPITAGPGLPAVPTQNGGGAAEDSGFTKSVRVAPAGQYVPSPAERNQQPGL